MGEPALDLSEIVGLYKEDARLMVAKMNDALLRWAEIPVGGPARQDLRRLSHQLRGSGRTYGFRNVTRFSKAIEGIMLKIEKGQIAADDRTRKSIQAKVQLLAKAFES